MNVPTVCKEQNFRSADRHEGRLGIRRPRQSGKTTLAADISSDDIMRFGMLGKGIKRGEKYDLSSLSFEATLFYR